MNLCVFVLRLLTIITIITISYTLPKMHFENSKAPFSAVTWPLGHGRQLNCPFIG